MNNSRYCNTQKAQTTKLTWTDRLPLRLPGPPGAGLRARPAASPHPGSNSHRYPWLVAIFTYTYTGTAFSGRIDVDLGEARGARIDRERAPIRRRT